MASIVSRRALLYSALFCSLLLPASAQIKPYTGTEMSTAAPRAAAPAEPQSSLGDIARNMREKKRTKVKVTPEEAKQIFKAVDEISAFASHDSELELRTTVKRRLVEQAEVERMVKEQTESAEEKQERQRGLLAMKKFGFLPRDFDAEGFAGQMMGESVAGFYDAKNKMVSLLNWVPLEEQESILAHELTHALQDQNYDLLKWHTQHKMKATDGSHAIIASDTDEGESSTAARCVTEGQAMVVMMDYLLTPLGTDLKRQPGLVDAVQERVSYGAEGPVLHRAPLAIREGMNFPYREGLNFEIALLEKGRATAFANALQHPPRLTYEILHPNAYLNHEKIAPVRIPDLKATLGDAARVQDSGVIGEFDTRVFIRQFESNWLSKELAKFWRGASYVTVAQSAEQPAATKDVGLLYVSRWQNEDAATRFASFYAGAVGKRYEIGVVKPEWKPIAGKAGQPISSTLVVTEEGPVIVEVWPGNLVIVTESFDPQVAARVRDAVLTAAPVTRASGSGNDLTLRLAGMPEFGALRDAVHENVMRAVIDVANEAALQTQPNRR